MTATLLPTRAMDVVPGDRIDMFGGRVTVTSVERGANRQVYIATVTDGGAPIVVERDPSEPVSVWRDR